VSLLIEFLVRFFFPRNPVHKNMHLRKGLKRKRLAFKGAKEN